MQTGCGGKIQMEFYTLIYFFFLKNIIIMIIFFAMVASGHLSVGTSRIFRERKKVCVCGPLLPVTADDEAAGTWNAVLHTDTHTLANTYA